MTKDTAAATISADIEAPEFLAHLMYALLTQDHKAIIDRLIEQLIAEQS